MTIKIDLPAEQSLLARGRERVVPEFAPVLHPMHASGLAHLSCFSPYILQQAAQHKASGCINI